MKYTTYEDYMEKVLDDSADRRETEQKTFGREREKNYERKDVQECFFQIEYGASRSRNSNRPVGYMRAVMGAVELYAEMYRADCAYGKFGSYPELKRMILEQAARRGVPADRLRFPFD